MIVNPISGTGRSKNTEEIIRLLDNEGYLTTTIFTKSSGDAEEIVKNIREYYDLILIKGGDGTYNEAINGLMESNHNMPVCFIPTGTTNELAKALNLKISDDASDVIETIKRNSMFENDIGKINDRYFLYVAAFGLFTEATYLASQRLKKYFGVGAYVMVGFKNLKDFKPINIRIESKEYCDEGEYIFGSISNAVSIGNFVKFNRNNLKLDDGRFEVILAKKPKDIFSWVKLFSSIPTKKYDTNINVVSFKTDKIRISCIDSTKEFVWSVDGEASESASDFQIDVLNRGYKVLT